MVSSRLLLIIWGTSGFNRFSMVSSNVCLSTSCVYLMLAKVQRIRTKIPFLLVSSFPELCFCVRKIRKFVQLMLMFQSLGFYIFTSMTRFKPNTFANKSSDHNMTIVNTLTVGRAVTENGKIWFNLHSWIRSQWKWKDKTKKLRRKAYLRQRKLCASMFGIVLQLFRIIESAILWKALNLKIKRF